MYRSEPYFSPNMADGLRFRAAEGINYGVDVKKFYHSINITWNGEGNGRASNTGGLGDIWELVLYFEEADVVTYQNVLNQLNAYTTSAGLRLEPSF